MKKMFAYLLSTLLTFTAVTSLLAFAENEPQKNQIRWTPIYDEEYLKEMFSTAPDMYQWAMYQEKAFGSWGSRPSWCSLVVFEANSNSQEIDIVGFGNVFVDVPENYGETRTPNCYYAFFENGNLAHNFIVADTPNFTNKNQMIMKLDNIIPPPIYGDLNFDGKFGISDLIAITRKISKNSDFTELEKYLADFNKDGKINAVDLIIAKRKFLAQFE